MRHANERRIHLDQALEYRRELFTSRKQLVAEQYKHVEMARELGEHNGAEGDLEADYQAASPVFDEDVYQALELRTCVNGRKVCGGPAADSVRVQIGHIREFVETRRHG